MKLKVICWLLACAVFLSVTALPMDAYATNTEATETEATEPATEATEPTEETQPTAETEATTETEPTDATEETKPVDETWHISDEMLAVLKKMEGFAAYAYWDYKQWSIGYGSECPKGMEQYYQQNPITEEYAEELLRGELDYFEKAVNDFIKKKELTVTQNQYDALVSFSYNCGANWTSETTGYFHKGVLSGDLGSEFVYGMFLWSTAGGQYVLLPRRICETYIYVQGVYDYKLSWYYDNDQYRYIFMEGNGGKVNYYVHGFDVNDPTFIRTQFTSAPTGPDESGALVTYVFDGWYTEREGGTRVDVLDRTITSGTTLYAHWKTPAGTPVSVPRVDSGVNLKVTVTSDGVNIRSGPQTYFASLGKVNKGDELILNEIKTAGGRLWGRSGDQWICLVDSDGKNYTDYNTVIGNRFPIWGMVTADGVNVRSGAGTSNSIVGQKNKGDLVLVNRWISDGERMWGETDEGYIAMSYITFENVDPTEKKITAIAIRQKPAKLQYLHKTEQLDLTGASILVTYNDGSTEVVTVTAEMVSGFDNTKAGANTITVTYGGFKAQFDVQIIKAKVVFKLDDGTVLSEKEYLIGDTVEMPKTPEKADHVFVGWDKEVTVCTGNAVYTAVFRMKAMAGVAIQQKPAKLQYLHKTEQLDLTGASILVTYDNGSSEVVTVTADMVSGFDNTKIGTQSVTVTYKGFTTAFEVVVIKKLVSISVHQKPAKLQYLHKTEQLNVIGATILVTFSDGATDVVVITSEMVSGFDNTKVGSNTITVTYGGMTTTFDVEIIKAKVIFKMDDGTVLSEKEYLIGDTIEQPTPPEKPATSEGIYVFAGWDKEVTVCTGNAVYTAVFELKERVGDINKDGKLDDRDAVYLLRHIMLPEKYPFEGTVDMNGDGKVNDRDAIYLLRHVLLPEKYPLPS